MNFIVLVLSSTFIFGIIVGRISSKIKNKVDLHSTILGIVIGVACLSLLLFIIEPNQTVIYHAKTDIELENGTKILQGTKLVRIKTMPEGFDRMALYVNVWGGYVDTYFSSEERKGGGWIIPYWTKDIE